MEVIWILDIVMGGGGGGGGAPRAMQISGVADRGI